MSIEERLAKLEKEMAAANFALWLITLDRMKNVPRVS